MGRRDLVGEEATRQRIGALCDDVADLLGCLDASEASAETLSRRRKYLLLVTSFRRPLGLHVEFVDEVESALASKSRKRSRQSG